jgi:site-specific recombinase XerD
VISFTGTKNVELEMRMAYWVFGIIADWAIEETWCKIFRHAFCTHLLAETRNFITVNQLARHSKLNTTEHYIHFLEDNYKDASINIHYSLELQNLIGGGFHAN